MIPVYTLREQKPVLELDLVTWGKWFETTSRTVAYTSMRDREICVSTVFLGIDHRYGGRAGPPVIFETMIFGGPLGDSQQRYVSWGEALKGHRKWVRRARGRRRPPRWRTR
jgi:hypothetical protein